MFEARHASPRDPAYGPVILYTTLRAISGIALRWFYRDVEISGNERLPADAPVLLVANHPNALVDALAIGHAVPRQVRLTAKGTFFDHPFIGPLFRAIGIIPLHRAREAAGADTSRNAEAFRAILDALEDKRIVLIFPEGTTHSGPELVPLKTGAARLALSALEDRGITDLHIVPVGLVFEEKSRPRSRVLVQFGPPLLLEEWASRQPRDPASAVQRLTAEIDQRLRAVTLNFRTHDESAGVRRIARLLGDALDPPRPVSAPDQPLAEELLLTRRVESVWRIMDAGRESVRMTATANPVGASTIGSSAIAARARALLARIEAFSSELREQGIAVNDVDISLSTMLGARFAVREGGIAVGMAPLAWWGRINHWLPFRLATALGRRPTLDPEEPAMHTIVWGLLLVLIAYAVQTSLVGWLFGGWWAAVYLLSLPPSASWDLRYRERLTRAMGRMRAYLAFRREPALQHRLAGELAFLRTEAAAIASLVEGEANQATVSDGGSRHAAVM